MQGASAIKLINGELLSAAYSNQNPVLLQKLNPNSIREDVQNPSSYSDKRDDYLFQQMKDNMILVHRKTEQFSVTLSAWLSDNATAGGNGFVQDGVLLSKSNFTVDSFALSKMTDYISIKYGQSELFTNNQGSIRSPLTQEVKSIFLDEESCKAYDQCPFITDNYGYLHNVASNGILDRLTVGGMTGAEVAGTPPYSFSNEALSSEVVKKWINSMTNKRVRILGTPVFTRLDGVTALSATVNSAGDWQATVTSTGNPAVGMAVQGVYTIEVEEYILESFLRTPYEKNKTVRSVDISPNNYVTVRYEYNTDYIKNGMFKWNCFQRGGQSTPVVSQVPNHFMSVSRLPQQSKLHIMSFDVLKKSVNTSYKLLTYEPQRLISNPPQLTINTTNFVQSVEYGLKGVDSRPSSQLITTIDQSSSILGQLYFIGADPDLWNGQQNATLNTNSTNFDNFSTFLFYEPHDVRIWIDQTEVTEFFPHYQMVEDTLKLCQNQQYRHLLHGYEKYIENLTSTGVLIRNRQLPFLILDLSRMNATSSKYGQFLPNVMYPDIKTVKIEFKLKPPVIAFGDAPTTAAVNNGIPLIVYPHIYKYNAYMYIQEPARPIRKIPVYDDYTLAVSRLETPQFSNAALKLDMAVGGGILDDLKSLVKEYGDDIIRGVVTGVRVAEGLTRDQPEWKMANKGLKTASEIARMYGYGK